ncbi:MAG TPA: outer membrane beta-barrel family protein [Chitinophagaceae bacterium]|nr:outer membrane beta-barrel family protein [Chitinophagaceae bacterium]
MKKQLLLFILFLFIAFVSHSQLSSLKGTVLDTVEKKNPENAVISVLRQSDSVLVKFARAGKNGAFSVQGLHEGKYIIMITHPYMGDYFDAIDLPSGAVKDIGKVYMTPKSVLLAAVLIKSGAPIRIKGDTTVYTADSFKVRPGANVEELLRRLPGIQVDKDGNITAMGERVKKVLVDGEEFFGSDPGIATKNLRADAVKEVEVFDKKSDQAEFTGIDDGVKDKTINLKMKRKEGYFGKVELGGGLKDKYNNAVMLNSFKDKRKLAGYGIMSNTGQTNLDWQDSQNYGGGSDNMSTGVDDGGGMFISMSYDADESFWGGRNGIPQNWNGGLHYSNKFGANDKQSFNSGYKFSKVNAPGVIRTFSKTFLPDSSWNTNSISNNFNSNVKHALNLTLDFNLDSANSLKWTTRANKKNTKSTVDYYTESFTDAGDSINNSRRNSNNNSDNNSINSTLLWRHKFKKLSRTLSVNTDFNWSDSKNDGFLYSLNKYYLNGTLDRADTIDQLNVRDAVAKGINTKIAYTEPLAKDFYLELSHSIGWNSNTNDRNTYQKANNGKYEDVIDTLSNSYEFNRLVNTPGLNFRMNKKKYTWSLGASVGFSNFTQKNITDNITSKYNYTNFFPRASYIYKFKPSENLRFNYNGSTTAPTLEQLQPIRVNTDPLNEYIGNPDLKQAFRHNFTIGYNSYNVLKEKNIWSNLNFNITQNAFVQSNTVDNSGKRTYQTVNANGGYALSFFSDYGFKLKSKLRLGFGPIINVYRNIDFINSIKNITTTKAYGLRLNVSKYKENKFDFYFSPNFTWNHSAATVNSSANADYWQIDGWANGRVMLPKNFEISSSINTQIRQKDPRFTQNNNFTTWNASITKRLLKDNKLEINLGLFDILDQNRGYQRNFNSYSFTEQYFTTLRRYWLLTVTWNISKNGKPASGF